MKESKILTICGSVSKFTKEMYEEEAELSKRGYIVLMPLMQIPITFQFSPYGNYDDLTEIHKRKIYISDIVYIMDVDGYIGDVTKAEIDYARLIRKDIRYYSMSSKKHLL